MKRRIELRWCPLCVGLLPRRRWWQRGILAPLPVHTGEDAARCAERVAQRTRTRLDRDQIRGAAETLLTFDEVRNP